MVKPLTEDGRSCQILIAMFSRVDQDEDGKIDFKQLQQALVNMGWATIKEDDCRKMISMIHEWRKKKNIPRQTIQGIRDSTSQLDFTEFHCLIGFMSDCKKKFDRIKDRIKQRKQRKGQRIKQDRIDIEIRGFIEYAGFSRVTWTDFVLINVDLLKQQDAVF